jgi:phosphoglycolate phosphatase
MHAAFELIMFDLDGTLIATAPEICDAVNHTLSHFNLVEVTQQQVNDWIGYGTCELLIQALASSGGVSVTSVRESDTLQSIAEEFGVHYQRCCGTRSYLYPQVRETLTQLRAQGVKLVVVTNKEERYTRTVLDAHQLMPLLDWVVSGDSLPTKKPHPGGILACLEKFGVANDRALFVGDSSIDVATARNAGIKVWALPYGYNMGQDITDCTPDRVIADCSALL